MLPTKRANIDYKKMNPGLLKRVKLSSPGKERLPEPRCFHPSVVPKISRSQTKYSSLVQAVDATLVGGGSMLG